MNDSGFLVRHGGFDEVIASLRQGHGDMGTILDDLNKALARTNEAVQGQAAPLWVNEQQAWNKEYEDNAMDLEKAILRAQSVAEIFRDGDYRTAKIMGQG